MKKGKTLDYSTYIPENTIIKIEVQGEKIIELLSKKWTIYRVDYQRDISTGEILKLNINLEKVGDDK